MRSPFKRSSKATERLGGQHVLIVSASIGGGHDGVAAELAARLARCGVQSATVDFLDQLPLGIGRVGRRIYALVLRFSPRSYESLYQLWIARRWAWHPVVVIVTLLSRQRLTARVRENDPDVVVSVYPLSSLALGRMRAKGWLGVPAVTYLTDFSAHPLWIHPGIDVHLGISQAALEAAHARGAPMRVLVQPLVRTVFATGTDRAQQRAALGLEPNDVAVLLVSGSWGVGAIANAVATVAGLGAVRVVCVCGRNEQLRRELAAQGIAIVIGWTDRMAEIMRACDVMIENAGGLTCMEALASGLPVVTFDPIAGHGRHNAELMAVGGVVRYARDRDELRTALALASAAGGEAPQAVQSLFRAADAAERVRATIPAEAPVRHSVRKPALVKRTVVGSAAAVAVYFSSTVLFAAAAAHGLGVDATGGDVNRPTVVGVRLRASQLDDPDVRRALRDNRVVAVVDEVNACATGPVIGLTLASTGDGTPHRLAWVAARDDIEEAAEAIRRCTGIQPHWFVALRRLTAFDWLLARDTPGRTILTPLVVRADTKLDRLAPHHLYLVDATDATPAVASRTVAGIATAHRAREIDTLGPDT